MKRRAFTLIELMIVVAVMACLFAVIVPGLLSARQRGLEAARAQRLEPPKGGALPELSEARIDLQLTSRAVANGLDTVTRWELMHDGRYRLSSPGQETRLELPFPQDSLEIREARLEVDGREPEGARYLPDRAVWVGPLAPGQHEVRLVYLAAGQERVVYLLPVAKQLRNVEVRLQGEARVAPGSLHPTAPGVWRFGNLVTQNPIALELPAPLQRTGTLFRLTGLAVALFGLGLWYLAELYRPGALRSFRLGGFFLLGLSYSTFFVIVAVLGLHGHVSPATACLIALALWAPPLTLHVAQIVDLPFALKQALPLGVLTLVLVVNGVYGGPWRDYVYLGLGMGCVVFLTGTYQRWIALRAAQAALRRETREALRQRIESALERATDVLAQPDPRRLEEARREAEEACHLLRRLQAPDEDDLADLERRLTSLENLRRKLPPATEAKGCCMACGAEGSGRFCPECGVLRPETRQCPGCQAQVHLPRHLLPEGALELRCYGCGETLADG